MNSRQRFRARVILSCIIVASVVIVITLYRIQIVKGDLYSAKADLQYVKPAILLFDRGSIFFASKDGTKIAAANITSGYLIYMNPTEIKNPAEVYGVISQYLKLDREDFLRRAGKSDDVYEELAQRVDKATAEVIQALTIPGIFVVKKNWRSYPGNELTANVLGIIGENSNSSTVEGKYGLERFYEDILTRDGVGSATNVFAQLFSGLRDTVFGGAVNKSGDIVMTIDPTAEKYLENILGQTMATWHPDEIGGIIMDPETGEIVAMALLPTFDPNDTRSVKDVSVFSNPLVEHVYEMGSIMKPLTMATALDVGVITTDSTYEDLGTMTLNGKKISNYDGKARGTVSVQEILSQSLNIGAATIALKVGASDFAKYFASFGLGEKTGIDQPNEATGIIGNIKSGRDIEVATVAYGQGIATSPIEMARALATLGNGGYLITPHIVKEVNYVDGTKKVINFDKKGPVLQKQTVDDVTRMLIEVVDKKIAKTHPDIYWANYSIAAKTGTAQIADHKNGGYYPDRYLHSFFGYFPAYNPRFLVFLYQIHPKGAEYASETLTDPFSNLTKFLINYYNIPPDR